MALVVGERRRELGLRLALGAEPASVLRMVISQAAQLAASGVVIGLLVAFMVTPLLTSQLYGIGPADPITFAAVLALLLLVTIVATLVPAGRAMHVDPVTAFRIE